MFDQLIGQSTSASAKQTVPAPDAFDAEELRRIEERLEGEVPAGPYVSDQWFAAALGIGLKTLSNRRSAQRRCKGDSEATSYPEPLHIFGAKKGMHVRSDIVKWLAREELRARTRTVHRCH